MKRVDCHETPFRCGSCGGALHFRVCYWPIPTAWYVHTNHRYRCGRIFGPNTATRPLL